MSNADKPAFADPARASESTMTNQTPTDLPTGLTKREYFAGQFLASLIVHEHSPIHDGTDYVPTIPDLCGDAVRYADALLKQLETPQS